jgi:hypothetical protein
MMAQEHAYALAVEELFKDFIAIEYGATMKYPKEHNIYASIFRNNTYLNHILA